MLKLLSGTLVAAIWFVTRFATFKRNLFYLTRQNKKNVKLNVIKVVKSLL